ncbi:hypothetical protein FSP39_014657 [Pinctada imbricata]|uniref:Uncharacterized protein n=1 Tax=Pinctada imbricata TaxID=66713 RepID=A0AA88Y0H7_PINIB|nr:hypothetical protein FSP39_014657 [Pinctada imbricata]
MILSSINFIQSSRPKVEKNHFDFSDFVLGKIREDQDLKENLKTTGCEKCGIDTVHKSPKASTKSRHRENSHKGERDRRHRKEEKGSNVTIETKDGYVMNLDSQQNRIYLGHEENANLSNVFRKRSFTRQEGEKEVHLCTFQLHSDDTRYISVSSQRGLQVMVSESPLDVEHPDERFFVLHTLTSGDIFIQPYAHKGYYLHHIDNNLYLRKLEINWRPPEEYFFSMGVVDIPEADTPTLRYSEADDNYTELNSKSETDVIPASPHKKEWEKKKISLFFGCFGGKSKKLSKKLQQKLKAKRTL